MAQEQDKEKNKIKSEIREFAAEAVRRVSEVINEEQNKRTEIKKTLADFHNAVNEREKILREDIARRHSQKMANIARQAEKLKKATACGDINAINDLLKKMSQN